MLQKTNNIQQNNETSLMQIFMSAPASICIVRGSDHVFELANTLFMQFVGNKEVINKSVREAVPELEGQGFFELLDKVYATGETITVNEMPLKLEVGNGTFKEDYFNVVFQPMYDANERVNGVYVHAIAVTEQVLACKKNEENAHRFTEMFNSSPSLISVCTGENMIIDIANAAILESWGKGNVIGQSLFEAIPESVEQGFDKLLLDVYKTGEPVKANEMPITLTRNGIKEVIYYDFIYQAQRNKKGNIEGVAILANEVTQQVRAKNKLLKSEKRFRNLVEQAPMPMLILKGENRVFELANEPMLKLWHVGNEAIGKSLLDIMPEIKDQPFWGYLSDVLDKGVTQYGNEELGYIIRKNGQKDTLYFNYVYQPYHEDDGSISGVMVTANDVTAQVVARNKMEESKEQQVFLLNLSDKLRAEPTVDAVANCALQMLSEHLKLDRCYIGVYQLAEDRGVFPYQVGNERVPPMPDSVCLSDFPDALRVAFDRTLVIDDVTKAEGLADIDRQNLGALGLCALVAATLRHGENNPLWSIVSVSASPRHWTLSDVKLIEEVTERTWAAVERAKAQEALRKSEENYRNLFLSIDQGFTLCELIRNKEGKAIDFYILEVNPTYEEQTGVTKEMVIGKPLLQVFPTLDTWWIETYAAVVDNQHPTVFEKYFENTHRWFEINAYPVGKERFIVLFSNITDRKLAEEKLKQSESHFRNLVEQAPVAMCLFRGDNFVVELVNEKQQQISGKTKEEVMNIPAFTSIPETVGQGYQDIFEGVYKTGIPFIANENPLTIIHDGKEVTTYINFILEPFYNAEHKIDGVFSVAIDVTEQVLARKQIEESEFRYHEMISSSPSLICILKGEDLIIEIANDAILESWGKGKNVIGKSLTSVLPEIVEQDFEKLLLSVYKTGEPVYAYETPITLIRNGKSELMHYTFIYQAQRNVNGEIEGVAIIANEVTPQVALKQQIKESESRFRTMADASPVFIWTIDANGLASYYNKTFLDFIGISAEEDISDWGKIVHPDDVPSILDTMKRSIAEHHFHGLECRLLRADGQWRWVLAQGNPRTGTNNEFLGFVGSSIDITERKVFEKELIEAKELAENAVQSKQQFLSNMSHEIRTPMNAIVGFTNVVLKTALNDKQKEYMNAIKASGESLLVLIDDILDLAKVDAGKMVFQHTPFKLSDCIETILHLFDIKIEEKNIAFVKEYEATIPKVLLGDHVRLQQILMNLISNAIKFTEKGTITVRARLLNEDNAQATVEFTIIDTGIGIANNKLNDIFGAFEQAHANSSQSYGGTGLGLPIVKQLVEHQGGSVSVQSKEGEGSAFGFVLPFEKTEAEAVPKATTEETRPLKNIKILVAEDVTLNQLLIRILLEDFGVDVDIADNGKIAVEKLKTTHFDMLLMDLQMPEMNGFDATAYIRNQLKSNIPIIALTADVTTVDVKKCKAVGMNDYISKPIDEKLLYEKIIKYLPKD